MESPTPEQREKYRIKSLFKLKGRLVSIKRKYPTGDWFEFILFKGQGEARKYYVFQCRDAEINSLILKMPLKTILRVFFRIDCSQWKEKWFTNLTAVKCEVCQVNEEKLKRLARQTEMFDDHAYQAKLKTKFGEDNGK